MSGQPSWQITDESLVAMPEQMMLCGWTTTSMSS